jgi:hypothetical protein
VAVLRVSSSKGQGFEELWSAIVAVPIRAATGEDDGRELLRRAQQVLAERYQDRAARVETVVDRWKRHELDEAQAANELLQLLIR